MRRVNKSAGTHRPFAMFLNTSSAIVGSSAQPPGLSSESPSTKIQIPDDMYVGKVPRKDMDRQQGETESIESIEGELGGASLTPATYLRQSESPRSHENLQTRAKGCIDTSDSGSTREHS
ncbi:hypothetical protein PLICRDRAFT_213758 [Plicaturopsis crispa FD-325 SS-3]|nr:hypothetical protein PLICRDRAFT_213758 [Plicaturopsis crispa FD-325 SS-3]